MTFVCPQAAIWFQIYERLQAAWIANGRLGNTPPMPLILAGWIYSSDVDKQDRWKATVRWAEVNNLSHLIPQLEPHEQYCTEHVTTSYPEQRYRLDRYTERERPTNESLAEALEILKKNWVVIAGDELATACRPTKFSGRKARCLIVTVTSNIQPPWGTWTELAGGPSRQNFTDFRKRINDAIAPVVVDHIDFILGNSNDGTP